MSEIILSIGHFNTGRSTQLLFDPPRIWLSCADDNNGPQTRFFRRRITIDSPLRRATISIFADSRYHLWVNGKYLARGPILHHAHRLPIAKFELDDYLVIGENVIAVLVHSFGYALHNYISTGRPGLAAELAMTEVDGTSKIIATDTAWRVTAHTGWISDVPRRGWAIGHVEMFNADIHPRGWQEVDYNDAGWFAAEVHGSALPEPDGVYFPDVLPTLVRKWHPVTRILSVAEVRSPPPTISSGDSSATYAHELMKQPWFNCEAIKWSGEGPWSITGFQSFAGAVVSFDLGVQCTGHIELDLYCESYGTIDVGWSEYLDIDASGNSRPRVLQKGVSYVDRVLASPGHVQWTPIQYHGGRYLSIWFREFQGTVEIKRVGMQATQPDLDFDSVSFFSNDDEINRIANICIRTLAVGTQEGLMDCPTREQACYVGDGHLIAQWISQVTGDARHWQYLVTEQFARQSDIGLIRSALFSGRDDALIDYNLIAILGTRDYLRWSGDRSTVAGVIECCRRVLGWFDAQCDERGLFTWEWPGPGASEGSWEQHYDPERPRIESMNLFIDHPGLGWHNTADVGIDRRGVNTAINALLIQTRAAMAELEYAVGNKFESDHIRQQVNSLSPVAHAAFFEQTKMMYKDGETSKQFSEQTQGWAVAAQLCDNMLGRGALLAAVHSPDATIARAGPYFWTYLFNQLGRLGEQRTGLEQIRLWHRMIDAGATTLWETFAGDDQDSACHPWSSSPLEFLLIHVAGLPWTAHPDTTIQLNPHHELLEQVDASICTPAGYIRIMWRHTPEGLIFEGELPPTLRATLVISHQLSINELSGSWWYQHKNSR